MNAEQHEAFDMSSNPITVRIKIPQLKNAVFEHVLRRPTFEEEERRERSSPVITVDAGKVDGKDASSAALDTEPSNVKLYDSIIQGISGYKVAGVETNGQPISPDTKVQTPDGEKTVLQLIPSSHKSTAVEAMFPLFDFEVETEDEFAFSLGAAREWTLRQDIGGRQKLEDGTLSPPTHVVKYVFREPTEAERKKFRSSAIIALTTRDRKQGVVQERRSTNLRVLSELFDNLLLSVEGAIVNGNPLDARNTEHRKFIPAFFKKHAILKLFAFLEADLSD